MDRHHRHLLASGIALASLFVSSAFAATPVDLSHQSLTLLQSLGPQSAFQQESSSVDFNKTQHIRLKQTYMGYPVWAADAIVHVPGGTTSFKQLMSTKNAKATLNGNMYQNLNGDLQNAPAYLFTPAQAGKALQQAILLSQKKAGRPVNVSDSQSRLMVYVTQDNKAHWVFFVTFGADMSTLDAAKPAYIMNADSLEVYQQWNNLQTVDEVKGGGFGGNLKTGKFVYDGLLGNLSLFPVIKRDATTNTCRLTDGLVFVKDVRESFKIYSFPCKEQDKEHNNLFWNGDLDSVNGGYSPADDAMFAALVIKNMYEDWYGEPPLKDTQGRPMQLNMAVHMVDFDNAYWDGQQMVFGDGKEIFYPLVSIGVAAHEISHGFTEQHSGLVYRGQSGGMNEAFSDMAAQATEYYAYGRNSWQIGPEIFKEADKALRYMDEPSKDCYGKQPGNWCSISNAKEYSDDLDVHFSSGVYNRMFYLLGTTKGRNTKMAFNVMVQANSNYWTAGSTFAEGACGILKATADYAHIDRRYKIDAVKDAIAGVGIDASQCL